MNCLEMAIEALLDEGASDIHLKAHVPVYFRKGSELVRQELPLPDRDELDHALRMVLSERDLHRFHDGEEVATTYEDLQGRRFRISTLVQRGSPGLILRHLPGELPDPGALELPDVVQSFHKLKRGLVLLTGPARSGKTTTLATVLRSYATQTNHRVITLESPIEYRVPSQQALVSQRQVGSDTESFSSGLQAARRQDPDVLMLGELPDIETLFSALSLATSGTIVYLTFPASSAVQALERLIALFPTARREAVLTRLSIALRAVFFQSLVPRSDGQGTVPVFELLVPDPEVRQKLRAGHLQGMGESLDGMRGCMGLLTSIRRLIQAGKLDPKDAIRLFPQLRRPAS